MSTLITDGSVTTDGTEQTLVTDTSNKTYIFTIDTAAMALGDIIKIKIKTIVRSAGTERINYVYHYAHVQGAPIKQSVPVVANISYKVTIQRISGTDRAYPWSLLSV